MTARGMATGPDACVSGHVRPLAWAVPPGFAPAISRDLARYPASHIDLAGAQHYLLISSRHPE